MIFQIPKGRHRARPLNFRLWWKKPVFTWVVKFDETCRYRMDGPDQYDTNKLCGIGYLPGHHKHSARFGWRHWQEKGWIEISAYCYVYGRRQIQHLAFCEIGKEYRLQLNVTLSGYVFNVTDVEAGKSVGASSIAHGHGKKLQYELGVFFGGNQVAPQEIKIELNKN